MNPQYAPVGRTSEDTNRDASPHELLLPTPSVNYAVYKTPTTYSITFDPAVVVRILSTILALISFIILVIDGDGEFVAADILLMSIIIVNILLIIHHFVSNVLRVTVELRQQPWKADLGTRDKPKLSGLLDGTLAVIALLCLIIGYSVKRWRGAWRAGAIIGYIVVLLQVLLAVPSLDYKQLTLTATLTATKGKVPQDTKAPSVVDDSERGSARRRTVESEEPRQAGTAEDLV